MKSIHLHGKVFNDSDFGGIVIGGQNDADTIRFVVPKIFGGELDLTTWSWALTYENEAGTGDTIMLESKPSETDADNLWIDWKPGSSATSMKGRLLCQLYAYNSAGSKLTTKAFCIYISEALNPDPIVTPSPSYIEQALALMAQYNEELDGVRNDTEAYKNQSGQYASQALASANNARASEIAAETSEANASASEQNALASANKAKASETAAKTSETNSKASETAASGSASAAKASETAAKTSETNAKTSETAASGSASAAKASEDAAKESETNASESEQQSLEYKQAIEILKAQIESLEAAAQAAKTAAETAQAQAEAARDELYKLIGGIPEDFTSVNYRLNDLEACHLEYKDDGVHLIIKQQEEA